MLANRNIFYITIPSDGYGNIFTDNHPGKFKAKLAKQILLPGKQWEVALSSITFPSVSLSSSTVYDDVNYDQLLSKDFLCGIELDLDATDKNGQKIGNTSFWLKGEKMKDEYRRKSSIRLASRDGVDFWNRMIASLNYKLHSTLPDQLTGYMRKRIFDRTTHFLWPEFKWQNVGSTYKLMVDNQGITNSDYKILSENALYIHLDIAEALNFVMPNKDGSGYQLTSLVSAEHFKDPLGHVSHTGNIQNLWSIVSGGGSFKPDGTETN